MRPLETTITALDREIRARGGQSTVAATIGLVLAFTLLHSVLIVSPNATTTVPEIRPSCATHGGCYLRGTPPESTSTPDAPLSLEETPNETPRSNLLRERVSRLVEHETRVATPAPVSPTSTPAPTPKPTPSAKPIPVLDSIPKDVNTDAATGLVGSLVNKIDQPSLLTSKATAANER